MELSNSKIILSILQEAILQFSRVGNIKDLSEAVCANARWIFPAKSISIYLSHDDSTLVHECSFVDGELIWENHKEMPDQMLRIALSDRAAWYSPGNNEHIEALYFNEQVLIAPITISGSKIGALLFETGKMNGSENTELTFLASHFALHVAMSYKSMKAEKDLVELNNSLEHQIQERTRQLDIAAKELRQNEGRYREALEQEVVERTRELVRSREELEVSLAKEKELVALKSHFVSTVSHQFRTPLAIIQSNSELFNMYLKHNNPELKAKLQKITRRISGEVKHMTDLMDDILVLGKVTSGSMPVLFKAVNMVKLCRKEAKNIDNIMRDSRRVKLEISGDPRHVEVDTKLMKEVLVNILTNACKYSDADIWLGLDFGINQLTLTIRDEGIGISTEEIKNLFQPFYRAENAFNYKGTGLGLAIAKEYIELNNGKIRVESKLNEGTTFTIEIPYKQTVKNHPKKVAAK